MQDVIKKDIAKFNNKFGIDYQPKYGFCPACVKTNIMQFYEVDFNEALEIYTELSYIPSALVRFNDYLFENIDKYKTFIEKTKKK